ncbi:MULTISPECIES: peptidoglycan-associated lipoprotein Pal [Marinobacter]|uniref:peptidoglycan-associated lipoprotein Pal n=1 Tax=Marinobacter TaxID=2742 RepID=UPI001D064535|nr:MULTISPECIES: peptidoglycan-associated lipoprotein Pal [Marinobacter]MCG8519579.1 peptidoglycan-associated lipoprotein Pal [Pseudomonadales bacterium]MCK7565659.1 peptidoglycan-associated lipoprotein Pal [Marinobacter xestospongiae]UDL03395.1 peptidoglycan-associated lipoprotein Pal [Marinobacter sp. CA1]
MNISVQKKAIVMAMSLGLLAGCSTTGETTDEDMQGTEVAVGDQQDTSTVYGGDDQGGVSSSGLTDAEREQARKAAEQAAEAAKRDITVFYFDFDTSEIQPEIRDVLVAHGQFLAANPGQAVRLEGHADERGTKEYNLALGERRAKAVERFLIVNGVSRSQIETVSYGEEKPAVMGSGSSTWAKNRRVELIYK